MIKKRKIEDYIVKIAICPFCGLEVTDATDRRISNLLFCELPLCSHLISWDNKQAYFSNEEKRDYKR